MNTDYSDSSEHEDAEFSDEELLSDVPANENGEDEPLPGWVPHGTIEWDTSSRLSRAGEKKIMGRKIAEFTEKRNSFAENVIIKHDKPFVPKPLILTDGPLKGCRVILCEETPRANFFKRPPEIRINIYERLVTQKTPICIASVGEQAVRRELKAQFRDDADHLKKTKDSPRRLALALVNKKIAHQDSEILYSSNAFEFVSTKALSVFLNNTPTMRKHLVNLSLPNVDAWNSGGFGAKLPVDHLQSIEIESEAVMQRALTGQGKVNVKDLIRELLPFPRAWHEVHRAKRDAKSVLDVVTLKEFQRCMECHKYLADCEEMMWCQVHKIHRRGKDHQEKLSAEFRRLVAEEPELLV